MYFKSGRSLDARRVFDEMPRKNVVAWNAVMTNAVSDGCPVDAVAGFLGLMCSDHLSPNEVSYCALLNACVDGEFVQLGIQIHSLLVRSGYYSNVSVGNSLIDFYGKAHLVGEARSVFDEMRRRDEVSWCSMLVIYAQNGMEEDAFKTYLRGRRDQGLVPTDFMLSSILTTCSGLSGLDLGRAVHAVAVRSCVDCNIFVGSSLVDMYGKCGSVVDAETVFNELPERNLVTWNSMIGGYAAQGNPSLALELFDVMLREGMMPNYVTLVCVISACARGGRTMEGLELFETMKERFGIEPRTEHYACVVDLLGRAGMEERAYELIKGMPMRPSVAVWGALLGACRIHGKMELGRIAAEKLFEVDPMDSGNHVLLSNMFASSGRYRWLLFSILLCINLPAL